jgi:hypothetical protein
LVFFSSVALFSLSRTNRGGTLEGSPGAQKNLPGHRFLLERLAGLSPTHGRSRAAAWLMSNMDEGDKLGDKVNIGGVHLDGEASHNEGKRKYDAASVLGK